MLFVVLCSSSCTIPEYVPKNPDGSNDYSAQWYEEKYIKDRWLKEYSHCQIAIKRNLTAAKEAGVYTEEEREAFCSCVANVSEDWLLKNFHNPDTSGLLEALKECEPAR